MITRGGYDLPLEDLICTESILRTQYRMAGTLGVAPCNTDR